MICHKCDTNLNLDTQVVEADKEYYKDEVAAPIVLMLWCDTCKEQTAVVHIEPVDEYEEVESPLGKVKMPKIGLE